MSPYDAIERTGNALAGTPTAGKSFRAQIQIDVKAMTEQILDHVASLRPVAERIADIEMPGLPALPSL